MSNVIVNQLIILFVIINLIDCNYTSIQDIIKDNRPNKVDLYNNQTSIDKRSDNVILDGIQYLPECGFICRLHRLIPPVMINFNHQYQHFIPISEPIAEPIPILNTEFNHHPELLYNSDLHNHHSELHHEISHPDYHNSELLHSNLDSDLGLHSKLFSDHHHHHHLQSLHQIGLSNVHNIHNQHLGLSSSNFDQLTSKKPIELNHLASFSPTNQQLHTSASNLNENHRLDSIQRMFAHYESKNPVTIVEENFPLPENYNSLGSSPFIETHQSSLRPLFVPDKNQFKSTQAIPPYELEDSRSNFIDYQPFHHHNLQPFQRVPHHFDHQHPIHSPQQFFHGRPEQIYDKKKPNIEIIKLNEDHDYPLPPPPKNHYDRLMAEVHSKIKDPTTYYQHPEPEKGSIIYADSDPEHKKPVSSKIDENSIINIGKNYAKIQHIQDQYNSMKRQYPNELNSGGIEIPANYDNKFENYNHIQHLNQPNYNLGHHHHHIEEHNMHFNPHIDHHHHHHKENHHQYSHISPQPPIHYEHINNQYPPQHHLINYPRPPPPKTSNSKPGMEFNGFYSNFYNNLPPAGPSSYSPYK